MEDLAPLALDLNCQTQYRRCSKEGIQCRPRMEELLHLKRTDPPCRMSPSSHHCHIAKNQDDLLQYGNGGNWETFYREGQSSSDAGAPPFLGDIGSLLLNTSYTEFGSSGQGPGELDLPYINFSNLPLLPTIQVVYLFPFHDLLLSLY